MKKWWMLLALNCWLMPVQANELGDVRVPVVDRTPEARTAALADGLDRVLVRLTGSRSGPAEPGLAELRRDPSRWVQQFSYEGGSADQELALDVRFDVPVLMRQLEQAGSPVWTTVRPDTLLWLVVQHRAAGEILSASSEDPVVAAVRELARERGLPLRLPLMDAEDQGRIRAADIRGQFDNILQQASARYRAPFKVAAVLYPGTTYQLRWRLLANGRVEASGEINAADEQTALTELVERMADEVAGRYLLRPGAAQAYRLRVSGVDSLDDWRVITSHAGRLAGVNDLRVAALDGPELYLDLVFRGAPGSLLALMQLDVRLGPCAVTAQVAADESALHLCWRGDANE